MRSLAIIGVLFFCSAANAYNVIYEVGGSVTAIGNLNIGGTLYNVDFEDSAYSTFGGDEFFWTDAADAGIASMAVNSALNDEGVGTTVNNPNAGWYVVIVAGAAAFGTETIVLNTTASIPGVWDCHFTDEVLPCGLSPEYGGGLRTAWSVAAVPVPATVWLFGSALAGLGWLRRTQTA